MKIKLLKLLKFNFSYPPGLSAFKGNSWPTPRPPLTLEEILVFWKYLSGRSATRLADGDPPLINFNKPIDENFFSAGR